MTSEKQKNEWWKQITGNWLQVLAAVVIYVALGIMSVEGGELALKDFSGYTWLDWIIWAVLTLTPAVLSIMVSNALEKEGIYKGKLSIQKEITAYERELQKSINITLNARSEKEYLSQSAKKKTLKKFTQSLMLSFVTGQMIMAFSYDSLLKILINLGMWAYFGLNAFTTAKAFASSELKVWYILETNKLMVESKRYLPEPGVQNVSR